MFNRAINYKNLLLVVSSALVLYALYQLYLIATSSECIVNGDRAGCYLLVVWSPGEVLREGIRQGIPYFVAMAVILFGMWSKQAKRMYWCLQSVVWLVGLTLWFQASYHLDPFPVDTWTWLALTALCSLVLFAMYRPLTHALSSLFGVQAHAA
ncbi:MAG TPA: hypothetical protein VH540_07715 [Ktedonobacterales bacterium]|jgi:hypothetical protein